LSFQTAHKTKHPSNTKTITRKRTKQTLLPPLPL
jgi:hypothetical protein